MTHIKMKTIVFVSIFVTFCAISSVLSEEEQEDICPELTCPELRECDFGFAKDVNGCTNCECLATSCQGVTCSKGKLCKEFILSSTNTPVGRCIDPTLPAVCQLPMDTGTCRAAKIRWFYDTDMELCQEFTYGGCPGNDNNFLTMHECNTTCNSGKSVPQGCSPVMCSMYCESGFKKDERGCDICHCATLIEGTVGNNNTNTVLPHDKTAFVVEPGCDDSDEVNCDLFCPNGYMQDLNGCDHCQCRYPDTCQQLSCDQECPDGHLLDVDGCPTCACRKPGQCPYSASAQPTCRMFCQYGFKKDKLGCDRCACMEYPCATKQCPPETFCQIVNTTSGPSTSCIMESSWSSDCSTISCMINCEHGFKSDMKGCLTCDCLPHEPRECQGLKCRRLCDFGFKKDQYGCDLCSCLPNPCHTLDCNDKKVCEIYTDCFGIQCRYTPQCSDTSAIRRVRIYLDYSHEQPITDIEEFLEEVKENMNAMIKLKGGEIRDIQAEIADNNVVGVTFYLVYEGDDDLVAAWRTAESHILQHSQGSAITYNGQDFIPQHDSIVSLYSSKTADQALGSSDGSETNVTVVVVIVCAVVGAVLLVGAAIVAAFVSNSKKNSKKRSNIIYKKAPEPDV